MQSGISSLKKKDLKDLKKKDLKQMPKKSMLLNKFLIYTCFSKGSFQKLEKEKKQET